MRRLALTTVLALTLVACDQREPGAGTSTSPAASATTTTREKTIATFPPAPTFLSGPLSADAAAAVDRLLEGIHTGDWDVEQVSELAAAGDPRVAWLIADLLRFYQGGPPRDQLVAAFTDLTGVGPVPGEVDFVWAMDALIAWDLPAWDGYPEAKRRVYVPLEPAWDRFFAEDAGVDWRWVTWGGVLADTRPLGDNGPCNCIPALDHPPTTDANGGDWFGDDSIVFGLVVDGETLALPKNQMEIHEMVNLTLAGRELGIPYCTLCGSAQAYFVDDVPGVDRVVLRTSGLLSRSNKLMYDLTTSSAIDTFTGRALTGPLARDGFVLEQVSMVASTWGAWKQAHPNTRIIAEDGGIGRTYADDPLGGRDEDGPIFPVGDVDPRLPIQEKVVGVITPDGTPVAFPVNAARLALADGPVAFEGLQLRLEDSIRVYDPTGDEVVSHEAFWFAWSQFHPGTLVWTPEG